MRPWPAAPSSRCSLPFRNERGSLKSEARNSKTERRPRTEIRRNPRPSALRICFGLLSAFGFPAPPGCVICGDSEFREWPDSIGCCSARVAINSDLGLRVSGLEWPGPTLEPPGRIRELLVLGRSAGLLAGLPRPVYRSGRSGRRSSVIADLSRLLALFVRCKPALCRRSAKDSRMRPEPP